MPFPPSRDLPNPGMEPLSLTSPALAGEFFTTSATQKKYRDEKIAYTSGGGGVGWGVGITDPTRNLYKLQVQLLGSDGRAVWSDEWQDLSRALSG